MPLNTVQILLFSLPSITLEDVIKTLSTMYCEGLADWKGKEKELISLRNQQELFFDTELKRYLSDRATQPGFLAKFVQCCTGENYLPFSSSEGAKFNILVEFNLFEPEPCRHPFFRTCTNTIILPGMGLYFGDYSLFAQKIDKAIENSFNQFNMQ